MKAKLFGFLFSLASVMIADTATKEARTSDGRVFVTFVSPERFTDVGLHRDASERERDGILRELNAAMQRSAGQYLREDLQLEIEVTDIDLAGDFEGWRGTQFADVRIVRNLYPPRMTIEFRHLEPDGRVVNQGQRKLSNPNFLFGTVPTNSDPLRHDKELFRDWLRAEFAEFRKQVKSGKSASSRRN